MPRCNLLKRLPAGTKVGLDRGRAGLNEVNVQCWRLSWCVAYHETCSSSLELCRQVGYNIVIHKGKILKLFHVGKARRLYLTIKLKPKKCICLFFSLTDIGSLTQVFSHRVSYHSPLGSSLPAKFRDKARLTAVYFISHFTLLQLPLADTADICNVTQPSQKTHSVDKRRKR